MADDTDCVRCGGRGFSVENAAVTALPGYPPTVIVSDHVVKEFVQEPMILKVGIFYEEESSEQMDGDFRDAFHLTLSGKQCYNMHHNISRKESMKQRRINEERYETNLSGGR